ncbi:hypothetical protein [Tepidimonas thermarum]|uniref:hypothetical protein n=1 Tax=Tepidimonas thermarum TaxID=335431 RepID=UPI001FE50D36|nr:hypothetical protein [Tepidimonas thermarum]
MTASHRARLRCSRLASDRTARRGGWRGIFQRPVKRWLTEIKQCADGIDLVVYEEVRNHKGVDAAHIYGGFMAHLTAWCEHHQIPYQGVPVGTIKKHATGKGNAGKAEMIAAAKVRGFDPVDDNHADALALLDWAMSQGGVACV